MSFMKQLFNRFGSAANSIKVGIDNNISEIKDAFANHKETILPYWNNIHIENYDFVKQTYQMSENKKQAKSILSMVNKGKSGSSYQIHEVDALEFLKNGHSYELRTLNKLNAKKRFKNFQRDSGYVRYADIEKNILSNHKNYNISKKQIKKQLEKYKHGKISNDELVNSLYKVNMPNSIEVTKDMLLDKVKSSDLSKKAKRKYEKNIKKTDLSQDDLNMLMDTFNNKNSIDTKDIEYKAKQKKQDWENQKNLSKNLPDRATERSIVKQTEPPPPETPKTKPITQETIKQNTIPITNADAPIPNTKPGPIYQQKLNYNRNTTASPAINLNVANNAAEETIEQVGPTIKAINKKKTNFLNGHDMPDFNNMSDKDMKKFISKTYKGTNGVFNNIPKYMNEVENLFGKIEDKGIYDKLFNIIDSEGDTLAKRGIRANAIKKGGRAIVDRSKDALKIPGKVISAVAPTKIKNTISKVSANHQKKKANKLMSKKAGVTNSFSDLFRGKKGMMLGIGINAFLSAGEYNEARKEGGTVLGSIAKAGANFAMGEVLGMGGMLGLGAIKGVSNLAVKGSLTAMEATRSMNNLQRFTPFADAQFMDTQQLSTMRQSGMELAKMSRYNLEQSLMGAEAKHLHR